MTRIATKRNLLGLPPFLNKEEAAILIAHIERDRGDAQTEQFGWKDMLYHLRDWKVWEFGSYVMLNVSWYCFIAPPLTLINAASTL
jgi:hypothetical protein